MVITASQTTIEMKFSEVINPIVEIGLTRKEMRITNAPEKQNLVGEEAVTHWSVESVNVKCGRSAIVNYNGKVGL